MWELPEKIYTQQEVKAYDNYKQEWSYRRRCHPQGFVDWSLSNNQGDPWDIKNWSERPYLHNFHGGYDLS